MARILKLDRMEILGFKSFYGRTRFDFPDGITAVVGPNGCGKSNIGDAISWVLGEQKASSLRSDRMEDVIFNGSEGRRPLGMAEVSLHFKNILSGTNGGGNGNGHDAGPGDSEAHADDGGLRAEAAATSDGDDHAVPIPSAADGEAPAPLTITGIEEIPEVVVITRRIYRSGESEYILNGARCRLKDIQDLLAKTDIGSRLYSTIEQGKIDQVLAARPKDRRAMFEEAAGILGYKSKRRQAEVKLEAAQANLLRVNDIVVEVDKQIHALRRQAGKARRYQRLVEQLKEKRLSLARRRLLALDDDRRMTMSTLEGLRAEEVAALAGLAADEADLERLRLQLEEGESAARRRREEIHALDLEIDRIEERLRSGREQVRDLGSRIGDAGREIEALAARVSGQEARLHAVVAEIAEEEVRRRDAASARQGGQEDENGRARAVESLERGLEEARARLLGHLDTITATSGRRASLDEQLRAARAALEKLALETAELQSARDRAETEAAAHQRESAAGREREQALAAEHGARTTAVRAAAERLATADRRAEELKGRAAVLAERLAALDELERQRAGFSEGAGNILKGSAGFTPAGVVGDRLGVPRGLEKAVEATIGELLEGVLVSGTGDAARGIAYLRNSAGGRVSFVPETRGVSVAGGAAPAGESGDVPAGPGVLGRLADRIAGVPDGPVAGILARTFLVEDLDRALLMKESHPAFVYVTPQGDIVRLDGGITGGDGRALQHWLLARRAEREEIVRQMSEIAAAREESEGVLPRLRQEVAAAEDRLRVAADSVQEEARVALQRDLKLQQARTELDRIDRALPLIGGERIRLERDRDTWGSAADDLGGQLEADEAARRTMEEAIQAAAADLAARRADLERVRRESAEARAADLAGAERLLSLGRERDALQETVRDARATIERRAAERDEWTSRAGQIGAQEIALEQQRQTALAGRAEAAARDEAAHAGLAYDRSRLHAREQSVKQARAVHAALRERQQERELHLARIEADLEHLERACRDELQTTVETLRAAAPPPEDALTLAEREAEVQAIRTDLEAIGPVNLMAVEQQQDLEERFSFLTAQKADLESAVASLRETIRTLDREARDRFRGAFEAIQGHFQECFKTLFGGGRAELRLQQDEEDVLEAGVEIVAQPPGKRLQKLALLSGGEKALTAVALLVSLFRYRPSPFCVLDEVDAPLDEANVERFTKLLQELRTDTQFILITHNRKSMEAADLLYGVTMEEPGVSKILPLRFE